MTYKTWKELASERFSKEELDQLDKLVAEDIKAMREYEFTDASELIGKMVGRLEIDVMWGVITFDTGTEVYQFGNVDYMDNSDLLFELRRAEGDMLWFMDRNLGPIIMKAHQYTVGHNNGTSFMLEIGSLNGALTTFCITCDNNRDHGAEFVKITKQNLFRVD
jgi:hypothetical protein